MSAFDAEIYAKLLDYLPSLNFPRIKVMGKCMLCILCKPKGDFFIPVFSSK